MTPDEERIEAIAELAQSQHGREGECEFDELSAVDISEGTDNGAYVRAWVWVDFAGTDLDKRAEDTEEEDEDSD